MRNTVYARLYDRLALLVPTLSTAPAGAVFCAPRRTEGRMPVYCHIADRDGDMRLVELADDRAQGGAFLPAPALRLRVDVAARLAEVLELEDTFGYQVIYVGARAVNPRRSQVNLFAANRLQTLVNFNLVFRPAGAPAAA